MIKNQTMEDLWQEHLNVRIKEKRKINNFIWSKFHSSKISEILFKLFEKNLKKCESDDSKVIVTDKLTSSSLKELILENNACAIHVPGFCSMSVAESLSIKALAEYTHWKLGGTINTDMFYAGGSIPMEVAEYSWPDFRRYFDERENFVHDQRMMTEGIWPLDRLRLELDDKWSFGAYLGQYLGQKLRPAIMRVMHEKNNFNFSIPKHGFIHTDGSPKIKSSWGTFSANIYLKVPEEGGELYVWSVNLKETKGVLNYLSAQILAMLLNHSNLFDMEYQQKISMLLPKPNIIKPELGDLVILHAERPHSVAPVKKGTRVTNQSFIYARGEKNPLTICS
jgi:hypothetical protein